MMMLLKNSCEQILNKVLIRLGAGECGFFQTEEQTISELIKLAKDRSSIGMFETLMA